MVKFLHNNFEICFKLSMWIFFLISFLNDRVTHIHAKREEKTDRYGEREMRFIDLLLHCWAWVRPKPGTHQATWFSQGSYQDSSTVIFFLPRAEERGIEASPAAWNASISLRGLTHRASPSAHKPCHFELQGSHRFISQVHTKVCLSAVFWDRLPRGRGKKKCEKKKS